MFLVKSILSEALKKKEIHPVEHHAKEVNSLRMFLAHTFKCMSSKALVPRLYKELSELSPWQV